MIKGEINDLTEICRRNHCAEHQGRIFPVWNAKENAYVVLCQQGEFPERVEAEPTVTEEYKQGMEPPPPVRDSIQKGMRTRAIRDGANPAWGDLALVPHRDLATNQELTNGQVMAILEYAEHYGLDARRGHVQLMYGQPYISIDGYLFHARRSGARFKLASRPLTADERTACQIPDGAHAWTAEVALGGGGQTFTGQGVVLPDELTEMSKKRPDQLRSPVVARHPWQMAQKRAEWQALRRAFPIGGEQ